MFRNQVRKQSTRIAMITDWHISQKHRSTGALNLGRYLLMKKLSVDSVSVAVIQSYDCHCGSGCYGSQHMLIDLGQS